MESPFTEIKNAFEHLYTENRELKAKIEELTARIRELEPILPPHQNDNNDVGVAPQNSCIEDYTKKLKDLDHVYVAKSKKWVRRGEGVRAEIVWKEGMFDGFMLNGVHYRSPTAISKVVANGRWLGGPNHIIYKRHGVLHKLGEY